MLFTGGNRAVRVAVLGADWVAQVKKSCPQQPTPMPEAYLREKQAPSRGLAPMLLPRLLLVAVLAGCLAADPAVPASVNPEPASLALDPADPTRLVVRAARTEFTGVVALGAAVPDVAAALDSAAAGAAALEADAAAVDAELAWLQEHASRRGYVLLLGGRSRDDRALDSVARFVPATHSWSPAPPLPEARSDAAAALLAGTVYVVGGRGANGSVPLAHPALRLDVLTQAWAALPAPLVPGVCRAALTALGGALYLTGGYVATAAAAPGGNNGAVTALSAVARFDPAAGAWASVAAMATARFGHGAVAAGGRLFVLGGAASLTALLDSVEVYDPTADTWTPLVGAPLPRPRSGFALVAMRLPAADGPVYCAAGGYADLGATPLLPTTAVDCFAPGAALWFPGAPLATPRAFAAAAAVGEAAYVFGGRTDGGYVATVELRAGWAAGDPAWATLPGADMAGARAFAAAVHVPV